MLVQGPQLSSAKASGLFGRFSWREIRFQQLRNNPQLVQPCGHGPYGPSLITACAVDKWVKLGHMAFMACRSAGAFDVA